ASRCTASRCAASHAADGGPAAQHTAKKVHFELLPNDCKLGVTQSRGGKAAGDVDRTPERRHPAIKPVDGRLVGERPGDGQLDLAMIAQAKTRRLRLVHAR